MKQRSNRGAVWLAAGVLGTVGFAAVVLAIQDHYSMKVNSTEEAGPAGSVIAKFSPQDTLYPHLGKRSVDSVSAFSVNSES